MGISVFEVIGPIMIGPSSSHTAGMVKIGEMAGKIINEPVTSIRLRFSPRLKRTYKGHRSDVGVIGGFLGISPEDPDIRESLNLAKEKGIEIEVEFLPDGVYPENTVEITASTKNEKSYSVCGTSVGGGSIALLEVNGKKIDASPEKWNVFCWTKEKPVTSVIEQYGGEVFEDEGFLSCFSFTSEPTKEVKYIKEELHPDKVSIVPPVFPYGSTGEKIHMGSCQAACDTALKEGWGLDEVAIQYEMARSGHSKEQVMEQMMKHVRYMKLSVEKGMQPKKLLYGLVSGNDSQQLMRWIQNGDTVSGGIIPEAVAKAIGVMEVNGGMGCVVAAPTAGSAGVVTGSVFTLQDHRGFTDEEIARALFVSGLVGVIMNERGVSFSGAVGGCQGEIGVSSAIAAAAITSLFTDDAEMVMHAMALCTKNILGLVCDPIAGPVEVPCIKRNAIGVSNAFISADMALAGIQSFIPPDEVIDALIDVEKRLPKELKGAAIGGLASTPTAREVRSRLHGM